MLPSQAAAVLDNAARTVLSLLLRGIGMRSDALSSILDDSHRPSTVVSSSEVHAIRYRGAAGGEQVLLSSAVLYARSRFSDNVAGLTTECSLTNTHFGVCPSTVDHRVHVHRCGLCGSH